MMKNLKYLFIVVIVLSFIGCKGILDVNPQQAIPLNKALSTSSNVKKVLLGAYNDLGDFDVYGGRFYLLPDVMGAGDWVDYVGTQPPLGDIHRLSITTTNAFIQHAWLSAYQSLMTLIMSFLPWM